MTMYALKDIEPNPFRHTDRYPISREKVSALRESFRSTGYWKNLVARVKKGKPEIAYGHHRLVALKEEFGPDKKVELITMSLTNEKMIQVMARENMEEWATNSAVVQETVRATVEAYAAGEIIFPKAKGNKDDSPVPKDTNKSLIRYAPSFSAGIRDALPGGASVPEYPYTVQTLAEFLGWYKGDDEEGKVPQARLHDAINALEHIDAGAMSESDFDGLSTKQTQAVLKVGRVESSAHDIEAADHRKRAVEAARLAKESPVEKTRVAAKKRQKEAEAKAQAATQKGREAAAPVMKGIGKKLKDGTIRIQDAVAEAHLSREPKETPIPRIDKFTHKLMNNLRKFLDPESDKRVEKLDEIMRYAGDLDDGIRERAIATLQVISDRCLGYVKQLGGTVAKAPRTKQRRISGKR